MPTKRRRFTDDSRLGFPYALPMPLTAKPNPLPCTAAIAIALALAGCTTPIAKQAVDVPPRFAAGEDSQAEPEVAWWESYGDPVLSDLIRPIAMVPEQKRIAELLSEFQRDRVQIAIVQDAQSKTVGLVTLEDLLEEIVGEIHEEAPKRRAS